MEIQLRTIKGGTAPYAISGGKQTIPNPVIKEEKRGRERKEREEQLYEGSVQKSQKKTARFTVNETVTRAGEREESEI